MYTTGFRLIFEADGLRVIDQATGNRYVRPMEAEAEGRARRRAEEGLHLLETKLREVAAERQQLARKVQAEEIARQHLEAEFQAKLRALEDELARLKGQQS